LLEKIHLLKNQDSSDEEESNKDSNQESLKNVKWSQRFDKKSVEKVCIKHFSCNYHSCIAVTENDQVFIWGRKMQSFHHTNPEDFKKDDVLLTPKYVPTMEIPVEVMI
jgi:hypothetical protein